MEKNYKEVDWHENALRQGFVRGKINGIRVRVRVSLGRMVGYLRYISKLMITKVEED